MNRQWFCLNDDSIYTCDLPTIPIHVYMAFYRPMPTIGTQVVKDLNMANVAKLTKSQVTLMFEKRPMPVRKLTRTSGKTCQIFGHMKAHSCPIKAIPQQHGNSCFSYRKLTIWTPLSFISQEKVEGMWKSRPLCLLQVHEKAVVLF